jgi:hypothetical protein
MHELSIALALVELTPEEAERLRAPRENALRPPWHKLGSGAMEVLDGDDPADR